MGLELTYTDGQTPLEEDEKEGLRIKSISTRGELNEFEQQNIEKAIVWTLRRTFKKETILTEKFVKELHQRMYGDVWKWAGQFRRTNKNIGVDKYSISIELKMLLGDCSYWLENNVYTGEEIALRLKHRIVSIHCFPNGNGRHARLLADVVVEQLFNRHVFSWGSAGVVKYQDVRKAYLGALRAADAGNYEPLLVFART